MLVIRCCLVAAFALFAAGDQDFQLRASARGRSFTYSPEDPAARTLLRLDVNRDGRIDPQEIAMFARSQNMDAAAATEEFASIDLNKDGVLDSKELTQVLGLTATGSAASVVTDLDSVSQGGTPSAAEAHIAMPSTEEAPVTSSGLVTGADDAASLPLQQPRASPSFQLTAETATPEDGKVSALDAARDVADQLALEEAEEKKARSLDREAAAMSANSTAMVTATVHDALDAGAKAAREKVGEILTSITKLAAEAQRAEVKSAAFRAKAVSEEQEARKLMATANEALAR